MAIDAYVWREEVRQKQALATAWHTANLTRSAKRLPSLQRFLNPPKPAKKLQGKELVKRRKEHRQMTKGVDVAMLGARLARAQAEKAARRA